MCCGDPCACSGYRSSISRVACWGIAIQTLDTDCVSTQVGKATFATPDSGNSWTGQTLSAHGTHQAGSYLETDQVSTHALPGEQSRQTQSQKPCSLNSAVGGAQLAPLLRKRFRVPERRKAPAVRPHHLRITLPTPELFHFGVQHPWLSKALSPGAQGQYSRSTLTNWPTSGSK